MSLSLPGDEDTITLASFGSDSLSSTSEDGPQKDDEEDINLSDVDTIDSAADFTFELCYVIFKHLKRVIGWSSPFLKVTDVIVVTSAYFSILTATFISAFHRNSLPCLVVFYLSDVIYAVHWLFITFVALSPPWAWSTPSQLHFRRQCRILSPIDLLSAIPAEFILPLCFSEGTVLHHNVITAGRFNRLIRVYRLVRFFRNKKNEVILGTRYSDILSAICVLTLFIHVSACFWYYGGCVAFESDYDYRDLCWATTAFRDSFMNKSITQGYLERKFGYTPLTVEKQHSWTLNLIEIRHSTNIDFYLNMYLISIYWSTVTVLSVGYGDYVGLNFYEILLSIVVMLLGISITSGMVVGTLTSLLTNVESNRANFTQRLKIIQRFLRDTSCSGELSDSIRGFYEYMWFKKRGQTKANMFETLPLSLQSEICLSVNNCALQISPMFRNLDQGFLRSVALKIQNRFYLPGQIVVNKGTVSRCMYYVVRGELEVLSGQDNSTPVALLRPGKLFGEVNLVLSFARTASIRAATHCDLLVLSQHDVTPVLSHYPEARLAMWEYVRDLFDMDEETTAKTDKVVAQNETQRHSSSLASGVRQDNAKDKVKKVNQSFKTPDKSERKWDKQTSANANKLNPSTKENDEVSKEKEDQNSKVSNSKGRKSAKQALGNASEPTHPPKEDKEENMDKEDQNINASNKTLQKNAKQVPTDTNTDVSPMFPLIAVEISPTDNSATDKSMKDAKSQGNVIFKESTAEFKAMAEASSTVMRQRASLGNTETVTKTAMPRRKSFQVSPSSRQLRNKVAHPAVDDEQMRTIPAFEQPDELQLATGDTDHRDERFRWTEGESVYHRVRRPTLHSQVQGMSQVHLGESVAVLQPERRSRGITWLTKILELSKAPWIHANGMFDTTWKLLVCFVVILQWYIYLYYASFQEGFSPQMLSLTYLLDTVDVLDIIVTLMTVVITPTEIYETYLDVFLYRIGTKVFYLDLIAAIPVDILILSYVLTLKNVQPGRLITICKLNKLVKAWVIPNRFKHFQNQVNVPIMIVRPLELMIYIIMGIHFSACVWYMDANIENIFFAKPGNDKWMEQFIGLKKRIHALNGSGLSETNSEYVLSVYWAAATMSTTGYGDIVAKTTLEYYISLGVMLIGLVLFAYSLASYVSLLSNRERPKMQYCAIVAAMEQFMVENRLDDMLRKRVLRYMELQWHAYQGLIMPGKQSPLYDLPDALRDELAADGVVKILGNVPLFSGTDIAFRRELGSKCCRYLFPPDEYVLYSGGLGRDMYVIIRGYCESYVGKRQKSLGLMGPGEYFGEAGMLFGLPRPAHVVTRTHCDLLAIPHSEFQRVLALFPTVNQEIREVQENATMLQAVKLNHARVWRLSKDLPACDNSLHVVDEPPSFTKFADASDEEEYRKPFKDMGCLSFVGHLLMPLTLRPDGKVAVHVEVFRIATIFVTLALTPLHIVFLWENYYLYGVCLLLDALSMAHMYLRLHSSYYSENSVLVTHPLYTAQNYLTSSFLLDLAACFPFDLIALLYFEGQINENLHIITLCRLNRLLQLYEVIWAFSYWGREVLLDGTLFKAFNYLSFFGLYVHLLACMWAYIACPSTGTWNEGIVERNTSNTEQVLQDKTHLLANRDCGKVSWYSASALSNSTSLTYFYMVSVLHTLEMVACIGYGDTSPQTRGEYILSSILMVHGVIFFGYIMASVTASLVNADITRANFNENVKKLTDQMKYEHVPTTLQKRVLKHVEYEFYRTQGVEAHSLFTNLPPSIREDVAIVLFKELISSVPIFETIDQSFHRMLAMCLKEAFFLQGETVIFDGDIGEEMFFIHRGLCDTLDNHGNVKETMGPGRFFGEVSVMFSIPRTMTIVARTNADLFVLTKNDMQDVLENYPDIRREIERIAMKRLHGTGTYQSTRSGSDPATRFKPHPWSIAASTIKETHHGRKHKTHRRKSMMEQLQFAMQGNAKSQGAVGVMSPRKTSQSTSGTAKDIEPTSGTTSPQRMPPIQVIPPSKLNMNADKSALVEGKDTPTAAGVKSPVDISAEVQTAGTFEDELSSRDVEPSKTERGGRPVGWQDQSDKSTESRLSYISMREEFRPPACFESLWRGLHRLIELCIPSHFIITPESRLLMAFNSLLTVCGIVSIMIMFYQVFFNDFSVPLFSIQLVCSVMYWINVYIRMHTAYYDNFGDLVCDYNIVKRTYMRSPTGFLVDMLSALPVSGLKFISPGNVALTNTIAYIRFVQLARIYSIAKFFRSWERRLRAPILLVRSLRDLSMLLMLMHIGACFWYSAACPLAKCKEDSWLTRMNMSDTQNLERYVTSLYFITATMTSVGYGDISPLNFWEVFVSIIAIIIGKFAFGLIIGDLASTLSNLEVARVEMETMLGIIVDEMKDQNVPKNLQKRVVQHVKYDWLRNRGHNLKELLQQVPHCLRVEVFESIYGFQLRSISIFEQAPDYIIRRLSALCEQQVFLPGDFIAKQGDIGHKVYIIRRGSVVVYKFSPAAPDFYLYEGSIYGDVQIVYPTIPYEHNLVADYPSDVLVIAQRDIQLLLADNPQFYFKVRRYMQKKYADVIQDRRPSMNPR